MGCGDRLSLLSRSSLSPLRWGGGELQIAEVSGQGVVGFALHDWGDQVGSRILVASKYAGLAA
jgi:hypothetical protein